MEQRSPEELKFLAMGVCGRKWRIFQFPQFQANPCVGRRIFQFPQFQANPFVGSREQARQVKIFMDGNTTVAHKSDKRSCSRAIFVVTGARAGVDASGSKDAARFGRNKRENDKGSRLCPLVHRKGIGGGRPCRMSELQP
jgi:hypothetical protein